MSQNVLVTGGAQGIGRAIAERFQANGARIHLCDVNPDTLAEMLKANPGMRATVTELVEPTDVEKCVQEATDWMGSIDVLVNNAGISGPRAPIEEMSYEDWDHTIRVNLYGMFFCIKNVLPGMKKRKRGAIVNISTGSVKTIPLNRSVYNVSKAAVEGLTRTLARELGPSNIRVNAIQPGMINNARMHWVVKRIADQEGRTPEEVEAGFLKYISMRTKIEPAEIADMAAFLASDGAKHVTGQIIGVDGFIEWEQ